jgi:hypothetical protein
MFLAPRGRRRPSVAQPWKTPPPPQTRESAPLLQTVTGGHARHHQPPRAGSRPPLTRRGRSCAGSGRSGGIFNGLPGHNPGKAGVDRRLREMLTCICVVFRASDPGDGTASDMKCVVARGFRPILSHPWLLAAAVYRLGSTPISHPPRLIVARGHRPPRCREPGCRRALHARRHHSFRPPAITQDAAGTGHGTNLRNPALRPTIRPRPRPRSRRPYRGPGSNRAENNEVGWTSSDGGF